MLGEAASRERLRAPVSDRSIDYARIAMPRFSAFRDRLEAVLWTRTRRAVSRLPSLERVTHDPHPGPLPPG